MEQYSLYSPATVNRMRLFLWGSAQ